MGPPTRSARSRSEVHLKLAVLPVRTTRQWLQLRHEDRGPDSVYPSLPGVGSPSRGFRISPIMSRSKYEEGIDHGENHPLDGCGTHGFHLCGTLDGASIPDEAGAGDLGISSWNCGRCRYARTIG